MHPLFDLDRRFAGVGKRFLITWAAPKLEGSVPAINDVLDRAALGRRSSIDQLLYKGMASVLSQLGPEIGEGLSSQLKCAVEETINLPRNILG